MQEQPLPPIPPNRSGNYSPASATGSDWSGVNNYNNGALRPDGFRPLTRGDPMTPPDNNGSFDARPPMRSQTFAAGISPIEDQPRRGPSENGSRASSRAASSRASDISLRDPGSRRFQRAESELRQHYAVLRAYLRGGAAQPPRTNKARDKLLRLSPVQFHELSTDVFDELQRRQAAQPLPGKPPRQDKVPPFLQPRHDFHEKRNQARQKLSSLQTSRFRDLSTDVFCELERRFPHFNPEIPNKRDSSRSQSRGPPGRSQPGPNGFGPPPRAHTINASMSSNGGFPPRKGSMAPGMDINPPDPNEFGRPMPKQFQSNTIIPNKSMMVEDDEDEEGGAMGRYDRSSDAFGLESSLASPRSKRDTSATSMTNGSQDVRPMPMPSVEMQEKISGLENRISAKDEEMKQLTNLRDELQGKLEQAESFNRSLKDEIERIQQEQASETLGAASNDSEWRTKHEQLDAAHRSLQAKYDQQLKTTEEVSNQFKDYLNDMRAIANENSGSMQREEQLHVEVQRLREESAEWKAKYTRAKSSMRNVRISTIGLSVHNGNGSNSLRDKAFYAADGLVTDVHVTKFQLSIDEMLAIARSQESTAVLDHVKEVVIAVRGIVGDVEKASGNDKGDDASRKQNKLKSKVSATTNNVITAVRNYAAAQGLSPVSLVDAAASHLTAAVIDLLRAVKIRPTPTGEDVDAVEPHLTPVNKNGYLDVGGHVRKPSAADSIYSALSDPEEPDPRTPVAPADQNGHEFHGLGIDTQHQQDEAELEELKIYLGNSTDSLVQSIQALVGSIRNDEGLSVLRDHINGILDIVDMLLAAAESGMEQPTSFHSIFMEEVMPAYEALSNSKRQLEQAVVDSGKHEGKPSAKMFTQGLPPLVFQTARDAKDLTARAERVALDDDKNGVGEDFS